MCEGFRRIERERVRIMDLFYLEQSGQHRLADQAMRKIAAKSQFQISEQKARGAARYLFGLLRSKLQDPAFIQELRGSINRGLPLGTIQVKFPPTSQIKFPTIGAAVFRIIPVMNSKVPINFSGCGGEVKGWSGEPVGQMVAVTAYVDVNQVKENPEIIQQDRYVEKFISTFIHEYDHILQTDRPSINSEYTYPDKNWLGKYDLRKGAKYLMSQREIESVAAEIYYRFKRSNKAGLSLQMLIERFVNSQLGTFGPGIERVNPDIRSQLIAALSNEIQKRFPSAESFAPDDVW